ncbi:DUF4365 domain-containing protein [Arthrobacter sp. JZ12]|uniref:DUF4365 domain-containing protein n=1 Tax=Arthrobacter sp. JZ12 TaxID=2654190 RepID=UPI002B494631|nr:DUF4365 domain-containing protein [Arthrobacter sp. JZ12]WRH25334.1 DUF4365 domain-containing protein [Arthrobacter sp. JZ12]
MTEVPHKLAAGSMGESVARVVFQRIGWAPPAKIDQDIGDDLITFARDRSVSDEPSKTYDLSAPVFLQVKASYTEYDKPTHTVNGREGWWFSESDTDHFDHWLMFGLPYLLVLVDLTKELAYWTHITGSEIKATGKGRKVFVPSDQRVEEASLEALNAIATGHRSSSLEGSAWAGVLENLVPAARLRNALVMPRLVAPHPNRQPSKISYEQATAMLLRNRINDLRDASEKGLCPAPDAWKQHRQWGWRFVGALRTLIMDEDRSELDELSSASAPKRLTFERDACNIVRACSAHAEGHTAEAVQLLDVRPNTKIADRGWMHAQRAHMLFELNESRAAAKAAQDALITLRSLGGDLSVSAIRGGCAAILYSLAELGTGDLEGTVAAQDNAVSWWRAQDTSYALTTALNDKFREWSDDGSVTFRTVDPIDELNTAALNAAFSANWSSWRHLSFLMAQLVLTGTRDPEFAQEALALIAHTGQKKAAKAAARRLWIGGPLDALRGASSRLAGEDWSRRSEGAVMGILAHGGDLLSPELADSAVARILDVLRADGPVRQLGHEWADRWSEIGAALSRLLSAASEKSHRACADLICSHFAESWGHATAAIRIATHLDFSLLEGEVAQKVCDVALMRDDACRYELLEILAPQLPAAMEMLRNFASDGVTSAIHSLLVVDPTAAEHYQQLGRSAAVAVEKAVVAARGVEGNLVYSYGDFDHLHDLAVAALKTENDQLWEQVLSALHANVLPTDQLFRTLELLAIRFRDLPDFVRKRVAEIAPELSAVKSLLAHDADSAHNAGFRAALTALQIATGQFTEHEVLIRLLQFRRDDPANFARLLKFWNSPQKLSLLATLAADSNPQVRAHAVYALIDFADERAENVDEIGVLVVVALGLSEGSLMHNAAASALNASNKQGLQEVRAVLMAHPSALIRNKVVPSHLTDDNRESVS